MAAIRRSRRRRRIRLRARRRRRGAARPPLAAPAARCARAIAPAFDPAAFAWTDAAWTGRQLAGGGDLRAAHRHVHSRGHPRCRDRATRSPRRTRASTHVELLPVNAFNGTLELGLRRRALVRRARGATAARAAYQRFVDARHMPRVSPSSRTSSTTTSVRAATTCPSSARTCATRQRNTWGDSVDLDEPAVRAYIIENALMWLRDYHVDGLRLDAVHALHDERHGAHPAGARRADRCPLARSSGGR